MLHMWGAGGGAFSNSQDDAIWPGWALLDPEALRAW